MTAPLLVTKHLATKHLATKLLVTKLCVPPPRANLVGRPRLLRRLDEGLRLGHKLTLISAPAGFGKTTLVSAWARQSECPTAWLSLDEGDNDPARFFGYVVAALQTVVAGAGEAAKGLLQLPDLPPLTSILTALINEIAGVSQGDQGDHKGRPYVLVLDDYHLVTARPIHEAMTFLLDHLPDNLHLVISTRADPPLPIARLRARGQLAELRLSDLRFTTGEAAAFLNRVMGLNLSPDDVAALEARTEGWISGLQMAAVSLQGREDAAGFVRAFAGSDRYVLDYLIEEVLERQPPAIQEFLLQTSILDRLSGPLCDAILRVSESASERVGDPLTRSFADSQAALEHLERDNLFIVPLDNERRWYRYHRLFADLLRQRLQQVRPGAAPGLHLRASRWYEQNGLDAEAMDHALVARDFERAADLVERIAEETLMRSEVATLMRWVEALPNELVVARPALSLFYAWALLLSGRSLDVVEARLQDVDEDAEAIAGSVVTLRARIAAFRGQMTRAAELSRQALERLHEGDAFLRGMAIWNLSLTRWAGGDVAASDRTLEEAARVSRESGNVLVAVATLCRLAGLRMVGGQLREARAIYEQALELATDERGRQLPVAGEALIGLGELWREWNDVETATRYLSEGIDLAESWGGLGALGGYISLARIKQARGDERGAQALVQKATRLAQAFEATEVDDLTVALYQARLWIAQGDVEAAMRWFEERGLPPVPPATQEADEDFVTQHLRKYEYVVLVRALIAQDRPGEALALLEALKPIMEQRGRRKSLIEVQVLTALACRAQGDTARAMLALEQALSLAEPAGYVRVFLDEGEPMVALLKQAAARGIAAGYAGRLLAEGRGDAGEAGPRPLAQPLVEPLSERELEVLRLLVTHLSSSEIAEEIYVSVNTVRFHIKNIYSKLGVHRRSDAVDRARELELLPRK